MKFLITISLSFLLVLALGTSNAQPNNGPCTNQNPQGYANFADHHFLPPGFDINSEDRDKKLEAHIKKIKRCDIEFQSFIQPAHQKRVEMICNGQGKILNGNLCISNEVILVIQVQVKKNKCEIKTPKVVQEYVIVACDKVDNNKCLPVHYEGTTNQQPDNNMQVCKP